MYCCTQENISQGAEVKKREVHLRTGHGRLRGKYLYSSTLLLTPSSAGVKERDLVPLYRRRDETQSQFGEVQEILPPLAFNPQAIQ